MTGISKKRKLWKLWRSVRSTHGFCKNRFRIGREVITESRGFVAMLCCPDLHNGATCHWQPTGICVPTAQTNLQLQNENLKSDVSLRKEFYEFSVNPSAESSILLPLTRLKQAFRQQLGLTCRPKPQPRLPQMDNKGTGSNRLPVNRCSTERLLSSWSLQRQRRTIYPRYLGGNRGQKSTPSTGSDHEFGQESPEFRTRTSVGGLSTYWATRRQATFRLGFGSQKAEQRFASHRETSARRASRSEQVCACENTLIWKLKMVIFPFVAKSFTSLPQISTLLSKSSRLPQRLSDNQSISS